MENKSFYFKWIGFKGFRKKYLLEVFSNKDSNFEMSESFEHRIQIYTRMLLVELFNKPDLGITLDEVNNLLRQCGLENQQRHTDKIHSILKFIDLITKEGNSNNINNNLNLNTQTSHHQIFTLLTKDSQNALQRGDQVIFKINNFYLNESFVKDINYSEKYYTTFNECILNKYTQWSEEISKFDKSDLENPPLKDEDLNNDMIIDQDPKDVNLNSLGKSEINELNQYKVNISNFNTENDEVGFALLRGSNWCYYIKKLFCIIGRAPIKYGVALNNLNKENVNNTTGNEYSSNTPILPPTSNYRNTSWHVDVDLGQNRKISKQHALIAYNFQTCSFEIQNLSKKYPLKVNGEVIKFGEDMPLSSKSLISIGNQEFYFLLPL